MERIQLIEAGKSDLKKEWLFISSEPSENGFENRDFGCYFEEYATKILPRLINNSQGLELQPDHVPQTTFYLFVEDTIVGFFKVRHYLTAVTRHNGAGHIGYGIKQEYRRRGYATKGLALAIKELLKMPDYRREENIIMGVHKDNIASLKVQQANGARIIEENETDFITEIKIFE